MNNADNSLTDIKGIQVSQDAFIVIFRTEWNDEENSELVKGCTEILDVQKIDYKIYTVPGAVELPFAISNYWLNRTTLHQKTPSAFITFGCVIKGDTPHFDYVCDMVVQGIGQLNITLPVPTIFGVLTVNNKSQAKERLGGSHGHKGREAAAAAIKMMAIFQ